MKRIVLSLIGAVIAACAWPGAASASPYPERPIRVIVPTTAGSVPDVVARAVGEQLATLLGQPVVMENRPGAGGAIGLNAVSKSPADGYTLGVLSLPYVVAADLLPQRPFDIERDLLPVAMMNWNYAILVVRADAPFRTVDDLVSAARKHPGQIKYSSQGNGTPGHLAMKLLEQQTGTAFVHVPYKGGPAAVTALLAGEVDVHAGGLAALGQQIATHALRPLATLAPERLAALPDVPTMRELGYQSAELSDWQGLVAPSGTSPEIVAQLASAVAKAVAMPELRNRLESLGMKPAGLGPDVFGSIVRDELVRWKRVVRDAHIKVD